MNLNKYKRKYSRRKQQIKYVCFCNSTMPLPVIMFPFYILWLQCELLRAYFIFRALQITLWKCPSVSISYTRSLQCQDSKLRHCSYLPERREAFCTCFSTRSWKAVKVAFTENVCCLQSDKGTTAQARRIYISLLFSVRAMNLADEEQRLHWL